MNLSPQTPEPLAPASSLRRDELPGEFLTFRLAEEEYAIDILRVQDIRSYETPTRIAEAPPVKALMSAGDIG